MRVTSSKFQVPSCQTTRLPTWNLELIGLGEADSVERRAENAEELVRLQPPGLGIDDFRFEIDDL